MVEEAETIENKIIRRDCIASIIDIINTNPLPEKKDNLKKIKRELMFKMAWTANTVLNKLEGILRSIDKEIKDLSCVRKPAVSPKKALKSRPFDIKLTKMSTAYISAKTSQGSQNNNSRPLSREATSSPIQERPNTRFSLEAKQVDRLRALYQKPEDIRKNFSKSYFMASLNLKPRF